MEKGAPVRKVIRNESGEYEQDREGGEQHE